MINTGIQTVTMPFILIWMLSYAGSLWAQEALNYWPLEVGNRWVYNHIQVTIDGEKLPDETVILEVVSQERIEEKDFFELSNGQLLRKDEEGSIVERRGETDVVIFDMSHLDDSQYRLFIPDHAFPLTGGSGSGYPATRAIVDPSGHPVSVTVPAGTFSCIQFSDGDLAASFSMLLAESVGPVFHARYTDLPNFVNRYELIEFRVGGTTYPTAINGVEDDESNLPGGFGAEKNPLFDYFFAFADHFGTQAGGENWDPAFDYDDSGKVDYDDFFIFADHFDNLVFDSEGNLTGPSELIK